MKKRISFLIFMFSIGIVLLQLSATSSDEIKKQKSKKCRVYVDMVADLFHPGHINFIKQALAYGDYLIVGIHSDEVCTAYKRKPIMSLEERVAAVSACRYVDEVIIDAPLVVSAEYLDDHQIDIVMHGDDFNEETVKKYYSEPIARGIFKTIPYTKGVSTSEIIRRILSRSPEEFFQKTP